MRIIVTGFDGGISSGVVRVMAGLSERSRRILAGLADGHSVEQILAWDLALRYGDVAEAAREVLESSATRSRMARLGLAGGES